jgi:hypothetical protein
LITSPVDRDYLPHKTEDRDKKKLSNLFFSITVRVLNPELPGIILEEIEKKKHERNHFF